MSQPDFLSRPVHPEASHHKPAVSPTYCLRQCPGGFWYLIPFIYEYGFEQMALQFLKECGGGGWLPPTHLFRPPGYAVAVDVSRLTFQRPVMLESHDD